MDQKKNPLTTFSTEAPEVSKAFAALVEAISAMKGLDDKTKQLVYIGIKASMGDTAAIGFHVPMALKAGANREEIRDAILISLTVSGLTGVATCLPLAMELCQKSA